MRSSSVWVRSGSKCHRQHWDKIGDARAEVQRQVLVIQKALKRVEFREVQFTDEVIDVPVVVKGEVRRSQHSRTSHFTWKVVSALVIMQRPVSADQGVRKTVEGPKVGSSREWLTFQSRHKARLQQCRLIRKSWVCEAFNEWCSGGCVEGGRGL